MTTALALPHRPLVLALFVTGCAQVPAGICFSDEACADAGISGGGQGGGVQGGGTGGGQGGGTTGGGSGGGTTGGGAGGGTTGGGAGGGGTGGGAPVPNIFSSLGIPDTWTEALAGLPMPLATPPALSPIEAVLDGGITAVPGCTEAFRGVVALPDGRALAIPFCTNRFAVIDPTAGTAGWLPRVLPAVTQANDPGHFGGAILGCDGRVYALPYHDQTDVLRVTPETDGGFTFENLPTSPTGARLSGGVIARPCTQGFRIVAAGAGGLYALDPTETNVTVTAIPAAVLTLRFNSVARLGDDQVLGATVDGPNLHTIVVNSNTLTSVSDNTPADEPHFGISVRRGGDAWLVQPAGWGFPIPVSAARNVAQVARQRWPTNSLDGWIFSAGDALLAWNEAPAPAVADAIVLDPAVNDSGTFTSGGLVVTTSGDVINVPAATQRNVITIYRPTVSNPPGAVALSPWFNKL